MSVLCHWCVCVCVCGDCVQVKSFKEYVELYVKGDQSQTDEEMPRKVVYEAVNPRWEVAVTASNHGFQQASFVNSIATTKVSLTKKERRSIELLMTFLQTLRTK